MIQSPGRTVGYLTGGSRLRVWHAPIGNGWLWEASDESGHLEASGAARTRHQALVDAFTALDRREAEAA